MENVELKEERKHFEMLKSLESFDASQLKKTITVEKSRLPNLEGLRLWGFFFVALSWIQLTCCF